MCSSLHIYTLTFLHFLSPFSKHLTWRCGVLFILLCGCNFFWCSFPAWAESRYINLKLICLLRSVANTGRVVSFLHRLNLVYAVADCLTGIKDNPRWHWNTTPVYPCIWQDGWHLIHMPIKTHVQFRGNVSHLIGKLPSLCVICEAL